MISWQRTLSPFPAWSALLRHGLSMWFVCLMLLTMMSANNRGKILVQAAWMGGSVAKPTPHISSCPNDMNKLSLLSSSSFVSRRSHCHQRSEARRDPSSCAAFVMYFDDISRHAQNWDPLFLYSSSSSKPFGPRYDEEKNQAMKALLGYTTAESTRHLSKVEVEEELRQWAVESGVVLGRLSHDDDRNEIDDDDRESIGLDVVSRIIEKSHAIRSTSKYDAISSVSVASCTTVVGCLARIWDEIVKLVDNIPEDHDGDDLIHLVTFPRATDLWEYGKMSTLLMACEFAKQQILLHSPSRRDAYIDLTLDLFHPKYKNSPKFWSPDKHSPFPTAGIQVKRIENKVSSFGPNLKSISTLEQLESLFLSAPAMHTSDDYDFDFPTMNPFAGSGIPASLNADGSTDVLCTCKSWMKKYKSKHPKYALKFQDEGAVSDSDWVIVTPSGVKEEVDDQTDTEGYDDVDATAGGIDYNYLLYRAVWATLRDMERHIANGNVKGSVRTQMVVATGYHDTADNFQRFAVTVNAALRRLIDDKDGPARLRVVQVFHPSNVNTARRAPFPMLELVAENLTTK